MCLAAHLSEFLGWTPVNVNLLLPPRQSRGISRRISPQDPTDESASALLERIRAERAKSGERKALRSPKQRRKA